MRAAVLVCVWSLAAGCADDGPAIPSGVSGSSDAIIDANLRADVALDSGSADAADAPQTPGTCEDTDEHLGVLGTDKSHVISRSLDAFESEPMSCAPEGEGRGEYVFAFAVDQMAILEVAVSTPTADLLSFGLFEGGCGGEAQSYCTRQSPWRAIVEPNKTYYLKVQAGEDTVSHTFNTSFSFEEAACVPGETTCSESASNRCVQGTSVETYSCAAGCSDGVSCAGDTCQTALVVEPVVGGESVSIQGDRWAYTHQWNAAELSDCEVSGALGTGETTDMELFVRVTNLQANQTLDISHPSDSGSYLYFVLDDCAATSCREAGFVDAAGDNRLNWEVPEDGDLIVVIEALSNTSRPFQFDFALR